MIKQEKIHNYIPPKYSLGESLQAPKPPTIDELLTDNEPYTNAEGAQLVTALREARALLERGQDENLPGGLLAYGNDARALLAKWRGDE